MMTMQYTKTEQEKIQANLQEIEAFVMANYVPRLRQSESLSVDFGEMNHILQAPNFSFGFNWCGGMWYRTGNLRLSFIPKRDGPFTSIFESWTYATDLLHNWTVVMGLIENELQGMEQQRMALDNFQLNKPCCETAADDCRKDIETLAERDAKLEELWEQLEDVPMDQETETIEAPFLDFPAGTARETIWHWFDERHSKGIAYLLYGAAEDYMPEARRLYGLKALCIECDSEYCAFNPNGVCLAPFVTGKEPGIHDDGCYDFVERRE